MQYNYSFEIAAVIIMLFLALVHLLNFNFELAKNQSYFIFLIICILESITNVASSFGLARTDLVSSTSNNILCFLFFLAEATASIAFFRYVVSICVASRKTRATLMQIATAPYLVFMFLIVSNPFLHLIYTVKDNVYSQGSMAWIGYFYVGLYVVASLLVAIFAGNTIRGRNRVAVIAGSLVSVAGIIIQFQFKTILLTGFSNAIALTMFYIVVQATNELKDHATNVNNDRAFYLHYENALSIEKAMQILLLDLHQQTRINVKYGYHGSKDLYGEIGDYLSELVGPNHVFLISGSVFAISLPADADADSVRLTIQKRFDKPWQIEQSEAMVPVKMAKVRCPEDAPTLKEFYALAEFIKTILRKNAMVTYLEMTPEIREQYRRQSQVEAALNRAIENKSILVYFQPIYDNEKKAFTSLEALARMNDEEVGFVPPDEFIEIAENNGSIVTLDLQIFEKCCKFIAEEILPRADQLSIETVQINTSTLGCMQSNMAEVLLTIMDKYQVPHDMVMIEITERAAVSASSLMEKHMVSLKDEGVKFALDDYGTGNSNCSYLIQYPFDKVKFDKNMVWSSFTSNTAKIILDGEIETIKKLNIPIVAEGVETEEQLTEMGRLGVKGIQGYYYSKPLPAKDVVEFLTK